MHMRTTLVLDAGLVESAKELTGIQEKTALVRVALEALIAQETAKRLSMAGDTKQRLQELLRRRLEGH
jgi:hypothetical protein